MMNKKLLAVAAALCALVISAGALASAASYDSSVDPIVTLSYLSNQFKTEILSEVDRRIESITGSLESYRIAKENEPTPVFVMPETESPSIAFEVVQLTTGEALYATTACEIILRSGSVICIAPDPTQGIADMTSGDEIYNGYVLTKNHMCLIPRGDGRGIVAETDNVFVMVRGDYSIVK